LSSPHAAAGLKNRTLRRSPEALADAGNFAGTVLGIANMLAGVILTATRSRTYSRRTGWRLFGSNPPTKKAVF
jgi:hypothetical protein